MEKIKTTMINNEIKLLFFIALISALILFFGYIITEIFELGMMGIYVSFIVAGFVNLFSYFFSGNIVLASQGAIPMSKEEYPEYFEMVANLCQRSNMRFPKLYYIKSSALNAFATGRNQKNSVVVVTSGLLDKLTLEEISGVVAHELSHILHRDILLTSFISTTIGYVSIMASVIRSATVYRGSNSKNNNQSVTLLAIIASILAPFVGILIKMAVSRSREYMADADGARICGNPNYLANALYKISNSGANLPIANEAVAHLYISNPLKGSVLNNLLSTHPDIDDRIKRLQNMNY